MTTIKEINAIIVDDEDGCITNLQHYLNKFCPEIVILATGNTLKEAMQKSDPKKINLAFLDIEIFDDNIFNTLSETGPVEFKIVFVTAYQQYALKALKIEAIDYILKPLAKEDILECYAKIKKHFFLNLNQAESISPDVNEEKKNKKIIIKDLDKVYIIKSDDIYYITGSGFYSEITFFFNKEIRSIKVSKPLNKIEEEYTFPFLFRVHKSHIVNINKISEVLKDEGLSIKMLNNVIISIAKRRANDFILYLNNSN